jgi:hypothetical protein
MGSLNPGVRFFLNLVGAGPMKPVKKVAEIQFILVIILFSFVN